jgi:putative membrane protein
MMDQMSCCGGGAMSVFMWLGSAIGLALVVLLIVVLIRVLLTSSGSGSESEPRSQSAIGLLEERFARGEIGREEFGERRRVLDQEVRRKRP